MKQNLKDQEIASFDEDAEGLESVVVGVPIDEGVVDAVLAGAGASDGAGESNLSGVGEVVDKADEGSATLLVFLAVVEGIDEVLELRTAELAGADAEDEADGVHEVGLTGAVGADDGGEVVEGADHLEALVGLEILHLQTVDSPRREERRHGCVQSETVKL